MTDNEILHQLIKEVRSDVKDLLQRVSKIEGRAAAIATVFSLLISAVVGFFRHQ